ncbi:MAG: O-antigen ligase family protein [Acidobacteriaceae bacterium]
MSRGGWLELILSIAILALARWWRNGASVKGIAIGAVGASIVALTLFVPNPISERLSANDHGSAVSRIPLMHLADTMIEANPFLGVGANNFAVVMEKYEGPEFRHAWLYTVHNEFLLVASETGIIGLVAYLWIYFDIIRRGWRLWKQRDRMFAPLGLGICAAVCGFMSHMLVDIFSDRGLIQLLWIFMAMIAACELIRRVEAASEGRDRSVGVAHAA